TIKPRLRSTIGGVQRICSPAIDGTYVDNAPVTRRPESRDSALGQQKWAFEVYIEQPIPVVFACLLDRQLEHDACIVYQHVQAAKSRYGGRHQRGNRARVRH